MKKILNEALYTSIEPDVSELYDTYIKNDIDIIRNYEQEDNNFTLTKSKLDTSFFETDLCVKANNINPCIITINNSKYTGGNGFIPSENLIEISVSINAFNYLSSFNFNFYEAKRNLSPTQKGRFNDEFTDTKIKSSIFHEITHWLDHTLNYDIDKYIRSLRKDKAYRFNDNYLEYFEINALMHNIYKLKKHYEEIWDKISFLSFLKLTGSLYEPYKKFDEEKKRKFVYLLQKRMAREGLLGKQMVRMENDYEV